MRRIIRKLKKPFEGRKAAGINARAQSLREFGVPMDGHTRDRGQVVSTGSNYSPEQIKTMHQQLKKAVKKHGRSFVEKRIEEHSEDPEKVAGIIMRMSHEKGRK